MGFNSVLKGLTESLCLNTDRVENIRKFIALGM